MWKQLTEWLTQMIVLARETQRNSDDIKQMRREIDELARAIERVGLRSSPRSGRRKTRARETGAAVGKRVVEI